MIYIDPPYNTGKEFIYPDKFQDNLDTYLKYTGQKDDEGFKISSNTESSGRYHTNWLNMMYPRLKLARNLLAYNGVLFVSIDDNEQGNLRMLLLETKSTSARSTRGARRLSGGLCHFSELGVAAEGRGGATPRQSKRCHGRWLPEQSDRNGRGA